MSDQPTGTGRVILPEGLTWEQVHLAVEIIQNWEIAGSSDAVELVVDLTNCSSRVRKPKIFGMSLQGVKPGALKRARCRGQRVRHALRLTSNCNCESHFKF
jgi:hypothetical protein